MTGVKGGSCVPRFGRTDDDKDSGPVAARVDEKTPDAVSVGRGRVEVYVHVYPLPNRMIRR
jgi:hypothetical protein